MANTHEAEQSIGENRNGVKSVPVHDMPDFMAALEGYKDVLTECGVSSQDANRAIDGVIEKVTTTAHKRRDGNRFINLIGYLSRAVNNRNQVREKHSPSGS